MERDRKILALVRDLMFSGRISAEARAAGVDCRIVRDPAKLADAPSAPEPAAALLLVDLALSGTIPAASAWRAAGNKSPIIAFAPHVEGDLIQQARAAGFDQVLTRGQFVQALPQLLHELALNSKETHEYPSHSS